MNAYTITTRWTHDASGRFLDRQNAVFGSREMAVKLVREQNAKLLPQFPGLSCDIVRVEPSNEEKGTT